jgi:hypothetical protein
MALIVLLGNGGRFVPLGLNDNADRRSDSLEQRAQTTVEAVQRNVGKLSHSKRLVVRSTIRGSAILKSSDVCWQTRFRRCPCRALVLSTLIAMLMMIVVVMAIAPGQLPAGEELIPSLVELDVASPYLPSRRPRSSENARKPSRSIGLRGSSSVNFVDSRGSLIQL